MVEYLSLAITSVSLLIDPEVIVLGGGVANLADVLLPLIKKKLEGVLPIIPIKKASGLGSRAAVMGAIVLVLDSTTDRVAVQPLSSIYY
jgi:glucokinase